MYHREWGVRSRNSKFIVTYYSNVATKKFLLFDFAATALCIQINLKQHQSKIESNDASKMF